MFLPKQILNNKTLVNVIIFQKAAALRLGQHLGTVGQRSQAPTKKCPKLPGFHAEFISAWLMLSVSLVTELTQLTVQLGLQQFEG